LSHEAHRFHEIDQEDDGFPPHQEHARLRHGRSLGPGCLLSVLVGHVDLATRPRNIHLRCYETASQVVERKRTSKAILSAIPWLSVVWFGHFQLLVFSQRVVIKSATSPLA